MKNFKDYTKSEEIKKLVEEIRELSYILEDEGYRVIVYGPGEYHQLMRNSIEINVSTRTSERKTSSIPEDNLGEYIDRIEELVEGVLINGINPPIVNINAFKEMISQIFVIKYDKWEEKKRFHKDGTPLRFKVVHSNPYDRPGY